MKTTKMVVAALIALGVSPAMADEYRVYRAIKPHWWSATPAKQCVTPDDVAYMCRAGAWQIPSLMSMGDESIAAQGQILYVPEGRSAAVVVMTTFGDRDVTFACAGQTEPLSVQRTRVQSQGPVPVIQILVRCYTHRN